MEKNGKSCSGTTNFWKDEIIWCRRGNNMQNKEWRKMASRPVVKVLLVQSNLADNQYHQKSLVLNEILYRIENKKLCHEIWMFVTCKKYIWQIREKINWNCCKKVLDAAKTTSKNSP